MGDPLSAGAGPDLGRCRLADAVHRAALDVGRQLVGRCAPDGGSAALPTVHQDALRVVYRALLAQVANDRGVPDPKDLIVVPPQHLDVGNVTFAGVGLADLDAVTIGSSYEQALELVPRLDEDGYHLDRPRENGRRASGSYYTPDALVAFLLDQTLEPLLRSACDGDDPHATLLELTVCDPACGSGQFLVAAAHRIADRLAQVRSGTARPTAAERRAALHDVMTQCVYGVDVNPLAVELTKTSLWLQCPGEVTGAELGGQIRCGNAILGAPADLVEDGVPLDRAAADAWCGAFTDPAREMTARQTADRWRFCHWQLEFPAIFTDPDGGPAGFNCVVGNPPFLTPLEALTRRSPQVSALVRARCPAQLGAYTDSSAIFLALSLSLAAPGGRVGLVQPQSVLANRDAQGVRAYACERASLTTFWWSESSLFAARVTTVALAFALTPQPDADTWVRCFEGPDFTPRPPVLRTRLAHGSSWAPLVAERLGVPAPTATASAGVLASLAVVTADFRNEYYGLVGHVYERNAAPPDVATAPLATTGLIDPGQLRWGQTSTRFDKAAWAAPVVDLDAVRLSSPALARWVQRRLVPKVLVATQGKVIEAAPDPTGRYLPCVPIITVVPAAAEGLWLVLAVLLAPSTSAWAFHEAAGSALSSTALKVSARQLGAAPLPSDAVAWREAADALQSDYDPGTGCVATQALRRSAELMTAAYGDSDAVLNWWRQRIPG